MLGGRRWRHWGVVVAKEVDTDYCGCDRAVRLRHLTYDRSRLGLRGEGSRVLAQEMLVVYGAGKIVFWFEYCASDPGSAGIIDWNRGSALDSVFLGHDLPRRCYVAVILRGGAVPL